MTQTTATRVGTKNEHCPDCGEQLLGFGAVHGGPVEPCYGVRTEADTYGRKVWSVSSDGVWSCQWVLDVQA